MIKQNHFFVSYCNPDWVGLQVKMVAEDCWIICDVLEDGRFAAYREVVPRDGDPSVYYSSDWEATKRACEILSAVDPEFQIPPQAFCEDRSRAEKARQIAWASFGITAMFFVGLTFLSRWYWRGFQATVVMIAALGLYSHINWWELSRTGKSAEVERLMKQLESQAGTSNQFMIYERVKREKMDPQSPYYVLHKMAPSIITDVLPEPYYKLPRIYTAPINEGAKLVSTTEYPLWPLMDKEGDLRLAFAVWLILPLLLVYFGRTLIRAARQ